MKIPLMLYPTTHCPDILTKISVQYYQDPDCCSSDSSGNNLDIWTESEGYYCISTQRWAFDNIDELINLLRDFQSRFINRCSEETIVEKEFENEIQSKTKETRD